ncbi:head GIN domain-containing protein [Nemorincola caseinilytica]|uniref:Head GIN domain-containing protein n=1 Tax=Nemorincola caseinilytica TaxID=2054315 RepID=A0ABP8NQT2_9BACT
MKQLLYISSFAAAAMLFSSCGANVLRGEGKKTTEIPSVDAFNAVDIRITSDVKVTVTEGSAYGIELNGYANILKHIRTEVKDSVLYIKYDLDDTWNIDDDNMNVRISVPSLKALSTSGAPDVDIMGDIKGTSFALDVSGASSITIQSIHTETFTADMSGASELKVQGGVVKSAKYEISGAGQIEAFDLQTEETETSMSGAAKSEVNASRKLVADISGAGEVEYKGRPEVIKNISGIGEVTPVDK